MMTFRVLTTVFKMHLKQIFTDLFFLFGTVLQPIIFAVLNYYMQKTRGVVNIHEIIAGSTMMGLWTSSLFGTASAINWERSSGTLELLVGTPTPLWQITVGKALANSTLVLISPLVLIAANHIFGDSDGTFRSHFWVFVISCLSGVVGSLVLGFLMAPLFSLEFRLMGWINAMEYPVFILAGFLFPAELLPVWLRFLSYALPPYWSVRAIRSSVLNPWLAVTETFVGLGLSLIYFGLARRLFKVFIEKAFTSGTLGFE
ncbi:hypothetical protein SY88_06450 [Clostridiales bacterium PH28_bin88]|nr:hypothetical protein SY88_06450 [Clostridiales bacterium PH28_bin88]